MRSTVKGSFTTTWMTWFAVLRISLHEDLMVNFWMPFLSRDFWICLPFETEGNDDIWRSSWVETTNFCSDAAKLWLLFPQLFHSEITAFWEKEAPVELTNKTPARDDFFLKPSDRSRVKTQTAGVPHQVSFCWKIDSWMSLFKHVPTKILTLDSWKRCWMTHWFFTAPVICFVQSFFKSRSWGKPLGFFTPPTAEPLFASAAFPPGPGIAILRFYIPPCAKGAFCVTFFFSGWKGAKRSVTNIQSVRCTGEIVFCVFLMREFQGTIFHYITPPLKKQGLNKKTHYDHPMIP